MHAQERFSRLPAGLRVPLVALALFLGGQCVIAARSAISQQSTFSEYLSQARRCVELNDCPSRGGRTGALPLFHGASWIRLLSYSLRAGGDQTRVQSIILGSWIVSIPIIFFFLNRYLGLHAATLALGLYFPVILVGTDITNFTYTNLLPLPWVVYYASVALFMEFREFRRLIFGAVASVALAAAVSVEMGSIVMVPFHLSLALLTDTPLVALAVCGLAFAIPFGLESTDAAREIIRQVPTIRFAVALGISGGVVALAARVGRRRLLAATVSVPDRVRAVMTTALIYATVTMFAACGLLMHGFPAPRYFLPASFPFFYLVAERMSGLGIRTTIAVGALEGLSVLLLSFAPHALEVLQVPVVFVVTLYAFGAIVRLLFRRAPDRRLAASLWPSLTVCLCAIGLAAGDVVLLSQRGLLQALSLADAERVVSRLYGAGYRYGELFGSLQGPSADYLMSLLTERDPELFGNPQHLVKQDWSLLVLKVPTDVVSRTHRVVLAVPAGDSTSALVVRDQRSYLDWVHMRRCRWTMEGTRPTTYSCAQPRTDRPLPHNWPYVEFGDPLLVPGARPPQRVRDYWRVDYEVPVHTPGHDAPHIVRVSNEWPATWRIVHVSGVEFEGELPAVEIRLPDRREATGIVEFEFGGAIPGDLPWIWLPHVIEVAQDNEHLLEPFRSVR